MLILVIFCRAYNRFQRMRDDRFRHLSVLGTQITYISTDNEFDIDKIRSIRNFLYIDLDQTMTPYMKDLCKSLHGNEIEFVD